MARRRQDRTGRPVTAQAVAEQAGVSRATVSRIMSGQARVAAETRDRVLEAAAELGYQVNMLGRGMNRQRSDLVGIVVRGATDPYRASLFEALLREIDARGLQSLVSEIGDEAALDRTIARFLQYRVTGVLVTSGAPPIALAEQCARLGIPVVAINRAVAIDGVDAVLSDNATGGRLAAESLLAAGCRHLGFLGVEGGTYSGLARSAAFVAALAPALAAGRATFRPITAAGPDHEAGAAAAAGAWAQPLDGLFCASDVLACGFLDGARAAGRIAPRDFSIIGFDDVPPAGLAPYRLTTIRQDAGGVAARAVALMLERAETPGRPATIEAVPVALVKRATVGPAG
ncbi:MULTISPECIES: LacI family DNA-binding transcriptional regulator [Inquilinus]|uniref:DNA-binding LacI/PurR family transcriptional regulator n=1 Tax=Inquilinus ginsengisoli TaxID=363840 RepID=A0ABU1JV24_9PROT|nr:LacI family DNA-binding transcriptional regulator [Inquilinus ginsengisoli]MDR6292148.1 DNA-binding LacI/PurR family transcriptional regulator [Inquilinus ginsengisoli]